MAKGFLFASFCDKIRKKVYTVVNSAMVQTYWEIRQEIHKACGGNDRAEYGKKLLDETIEIYIEKLKKYYIKRS